MIENYWDISEEENSSSAMHLASAKKKTALRCKQAIGGAARSVRQVGIVGAGTMGAGIVLSLINNGIEVLLYDVSADGRDLALDWVDKQVRRAVQKGRIKQNAYQQTMSLLTLCDSLGSFSSVDLVIEAVFESIKVKQSVFRELDQVCKDGAILGTNTSTLDIDVIASATRRPEDVIGLHFFSPANVMPLLEIIRGRKTKIDVQTTAIQLASDIGKVGVVVGNCYGFAGNRMIEGFSREANRLLLEGVSPVQIDSAMMKFGMAMGPFATADLVGIDVPFKARQENSQAAEGDFAYYRMADLLVDNGWLGRKTGRGYYAYEDGAAPTLNPDLMRYAKSEAESLGVVQKTDVSDEEIVERCLLPLIAEGTKILQEGIAECASDLDVIMVLGYGFPRDRGGPMRFADTVGLNSVVERMREFATTQPHYWEPCDLLASLAENNRSFADYDCGK